MSKLKRKCHFNDELQRQMKYQCFSKTSDSTVVKCTLCNSNVTIANGGVYFYFFIPIQTNINAEAAK